MARRLTEEQRKKARLRSKRWAIANAERVKANFARWYAVNKHRVIKSASEWKKKNPERYAKNQSAWRKVVSSRRCLQVVKRRAESIKATPSWANEFFIEEAYDLAKRRSKLKSGGFAKWHVDHIVPLKSHLVCGLHVENNLRVIPGVVNLSKGNRHWPDMP